MTLPNTSSPYEFVIFPWNDNFATGIAIIDEQHKVLVAILNKLANHCVHEASNTANLDALVQELADVAIIQGFINISKAFELDTIAEGVETIEQGQLLLSMGCHSHKVMLYQNPC